MKSIVMVLMMLGSFSNNIDFNNEISYKSKRVEKERIIYVLTNMYNDVEELITTSLYCFDKNKDSLTKEEKKAFYKLMPLLYLFRNKLKIILVFA